MSKKFKSFVVGRDEFPQWFKEQAKVGRAQVNYDEEDSSLINVVIYGATKNYTAQPGDTIVMSKYGIAVRKNEEINNKEEKRDVQK